MTPEEISLKEHEIAVKKLEVVGAATCREAALILGIKEQTLRRACRETPPKIAYKKDGKFYYFPKHAIKEYMGGDYTGID
jgi:predicted DNA-binding protein (UPF0251 family)